MATPIYYPPSVNNLQKEINADYTAGASTVTLNNTTNIQNKPGVCVVSRVNSAGIRQVVSKWTYLKFTGTSGNTLTGVTAISGDQDHAIGEVVEFVPDVTWAEQVAGGFATLLDATDVSKVNTTNVITPDGTQTLTNKTLTSPVVNTPTIVTPIVKTAYSIGAAGATETVNWANGDLQTMTLDENVTITFSNAVAGQRLTLFLLQDGSGTNTITWADTIVWQDGITWGDTYYTKTANKMNVVVIYYSGSAYFGMVAKFA